MITLIPMVVPETLQVTLDNTFGTNVFVVGVDKNIVPKQYYLEYENSTSQSLVDQAVILSDENATNLLQETQLRLYQSINTVAVNTIAAKEKPPFSDTDIQEVTIWYQDQGLPCPGCVLFLSVKDNISQQQAAQNIINYKTTYQAFVDQVDGIKIQGQNELMIQTDLLAAKNSATTTMDQIKNLL